jgi:hypothetical protein
VGWTVSGLGRQRGGWHWVGPSTGRPARGGRCRGRGRAGNGAGSAEAEPATGWAAPGQASDGAGQAPQGWAGYWDGGGGTGLGWLLGRRQRPWGGRRVALGRAAPGTGQTTRGRAAPGTGQMMTPRGGDCDAIAVLGEGGGGGQR